MTFLEWLSKERPEELPNQVMLLKDAWELGQAAERERIKERVKGAAESVWGIRDYFDGCSQYIGPSLNTLEEFVEKLLEED